MSSIDLAQASMSLQSVSNIRRRVVELAQLWLIESTRSKGCEGEARFSTWSARRNGSSSVFTLGKKDG